MNKIIATDAAPKAIGPYSQAVAVNGFLFVSGQIPLDPLTGEIVAGGIEEQTLQVMRNIGAILHAAGYGFEHVVKTTVLLSNMEDFVKMNAVYGQFFSADMPARAAFQVAALPRNAMVEIEVVAAQ